MLRLERVSKFYSAHGMVSTGFSKVDLEFHPGEFVAITGESGSGKSTLLNVISGLDSFEEGEMFILDQPTSGFSKEDLEEYRKKYIGNIFQTFNLINSYTVYQNVELVLLMSGYDKKEIPAKVHDIIAKVGLSDYEKTKASKLSGGQKQRVAIARALAKETPIIVADEPTGNLDSKAAAEVIKLLHDLSREKLIIIVTHNFEQVEPFVTRKITMHDGRVAEDKRMNDHRPKPPAPVSEIQTAKADGLKFGSMTRLGVRNTFNLPAKFMLLLLVFVFLCSGVIGQYAAFMNIGDLMGQQGWNRYFNDMDERRILLNREDRKEFTDEDYAKISKISNIDRIIKNDTMMDQMANLTNDRENSSFWINARVDDASAYETQVTFGRMPKNSREAILIFPTEGYVNQYIDDVMAKKIFVTDQMNGADMMKDKIKVVGYGYTTKEQEETMHGQSYYLEAFLGVNEEAMDNVRFAVLERACKQEYELADKIMDGNSGQGLLPIRKSKEVPQGELYIPEEVGFMAPYGAAGREIKVTNKSLYFKDKKTFTVGAVYNKNTLEYWLGLKNFDAVSGSIFMNPKDYNKMFDKGNFQSSVMLGDAKLADATIKKLEDAGYKTFKVSDGLVSYSEGFDIVSDTLRTVVLAGMLVVLFFITYFIVKLILKSRNTYFSTIRMLGATKGNCGSLLRVELFVVFNIAFAICMGFVSLVKGEMIKGDTLYQILSYFDGKDFIVLYIVLCLMSILLASRFARQLFKQTAMNAYKEEV